MARSAISLRFRLAALTGALVLGMGVLFGGLAYREVRRSEIGETSDRLRRATSGLRDILEGRTRRTRTQQEALARHPVVRRAFDEQAARASLSIAELDGAAAAAGVIGPSLIGVSLLDTSGVARTETPVPIAPFGPAQGRALIALARENGGAAIGALEARGDSARYATIATVVDSGRASGYVVSWRRLVFSADEQAAVAARIGPGARLFIGNAAGDVWTDLARVVGAPSLDMAEFRARTARAQGATSATPATSAEHLGVVAPLGQAPWVVVVEVPRAVALARAASVLRTMTAGGAVLLVLGALGAWWLSTALVRPISTLAAASQALQRGDYSTRVEISDTQELEALGNALNTVSANIDEAQRALERKVRELEASEARYRLLFSQSPHPMWVYDVATLRFLAVNDAVVRAYGYSADEFLSMTILDIRTPSEAAALLSQIKSPIPGMIDGLASRHRRKDGTSVDVEISSRAIEFDGRTARLSLIQDVTERRRNEAALGAATRRLENVLASSGAVIYQLTPLGDRWALEWISENVTRLYGYAPAEALAEGWWRDNVHPEDFRHLRDEGEGSAATPGAAIREFRFRHRDGSYRWVRDEQRVMRDALGAAIDVVGIWLDITAHRELEQQFRQAQKMEAVGRLAGGVAHDFNNLLTVIIGECDIALGDLEEDAPVRESVLEIRRAGDRASMLTRQLLLFARRQLVEPAILGGNDVVRDLDSTFRRLVGDSIEVRTRLASDLAPVRADRGQLEQVLVNLVVNARDAMPQGGTLLIESANVRLDDAYASTHAGVAVGDYVVLSVSDSGTGIAPEAKTHLFEPFFTTKAAGHGTGLGLATCYTIVKQYGGHIDVYSEVDRGTTMRVYLPRATGAVTERERSDRAASVGGRETIMLVEDDQRVRAVGARILRSRGYTVVEAGDGKEALEQMLGYDGEVHLLLTDLMLPRMGGRELAERTRRVRPDAKVLFTSGYTEDAMLQQQILEREIALVHKPFSSESLLRKVRETLDKVLETN